MFDSAPNNCFLVKSVLLTACEWCLSELCYYHLVLTVITHVNERVWTASFQCDV